MLLFIPFVILVGTVTLMVASALNADGRRLSPREKALAWTAVLVVFELFYLFTLSQWGGSDAELVFGAVLPFATLGLGAITVWVLKH